jgi:hypothetical protein
VEGRQRTRLGQGDAAAQEGKREERRGAEGELDRGTAHAGGKGRREGSELGLGRGRKGERREECWTGPRRRFGLPYSFSFPFLFLYSSHSNKSS